MLPNWRSSLCRLLAVLRVLGERTPGLTVGDLRHWIIYRPLAIALALLLAMPIISEFEGGAPGARHFLASAQGGGCGPAFPNAIIQVDCVNGQLFNLFGDLAQLESDSVSAYLGLHNLPATDASVIYSYGRSDLRDAVRGIMLSILLGIIAKPASSRTQHEQLLYKWLQTLVQKNEISMYTNAISQFNSWEANPCTFTLDPAIASSYGLSYDGAPFCFASLSSLFGGTSIPAESYFTAYGMKQSYGAAANSFPYFGSLTAGMAISVGEVAGIATAAGGVVAAAAAGLLFASLTASMAAFTTATTAAATGAAASAAFVVAGSTVAELGPVLLAAGPAAIILIAIAIGVAAAMQLLNEGKELDDLANMTASLNQVTNTPPDLNSFVTDSSGVGMYKLQTTLAAQTVPEVASTAALPAHRPATDLNFAISPPSGGTPAVSSTLTYRDWNQTPWSAQTWGGWFVQTCTGASGTCPQADSIIPSVRYVDWSGVNWSASRIGNNFVSTKAQPALTDSPCVADTLTGLSAGTDFSKCSSYVSAAIPLTDGNGNHVTAGLSLLSAPVFNSSTNLVFSPGTSSTQTITAVGNPAPTICLTSGSLTGDFSLNGGQCGTGSFQLSFNGNINAPNQVYPLTLTATNSVGSVSQTVSINVSVQLNIISSGAIRGTAGYPVNFLVVATGVPTPRFSLENFSFANYGLTFTDNGNGTATISGVVPDPVSSICIEPCGIVASNSQGSVLQTPQVLMASAPEATLVPPNSVNFVAGAPNQALLTATGAATPVSWSIEQDAEPDPPPSWLSLHDNGDGTALLKGTPPAGTADTITTGLTTQALGAFGYINALTINVVNTPAFLNPNTATFTVGNSGTFDISTTGGSVSLVNTLPQGLSFTSVPSITGIPAAGTGGQYTIALTDEGGLAGSSSQSLSLNVYEAPKITSANTATFFTGVPGSFAVTTTGFPSLSTHSVPSDVNSRNPTSPDQGGGMVFHVGGLPADLQFSNLNSQSFATGTLTIQGTPSTADARVYQVDIEALNGVGLPASQTLTINVVAAAPTPAGSISATASGLAYSRISKTFNGTVTLKNVISGSIDGPFQVVFTGLPADVALANATGMWNGVPYMTVPGLTRLNPGQSAVISLQFKNPSNAAIQFTPMVYGGVN
jgi:hypothetical protein